MPYGLAEAAVPYWRRLAPMLAKRGILVESDVPALADMCMVKARLDEAEAELTKDGLTSTGAVGQMVRHPLTMVVGQYRAAWLSYCTRFALTPSDRAGVTVEKPTEKTLAEQLNDVVKAGQQLA
jgi:P27 family predicted phage terminase small subunit